MAKSYRELLVWQKAIQLTALVYQISKAFPREEVYGLTGQMRRSAVSIPSNIAEGAGRLNTREYQVVGQFEKGEPQGLKPSDIAGLNVRAEARTLQTDPLPGINTFSGLREARILSCKRS